MTDLSHLMGLDVEVPQIKLRPLDSLVHYARNSRTHSAAQVEQLEGLLLEFGWTNAALVDDMGLVAGHGRCMAAANIYKRGEQIKFPNGTAIPIGMVPTLDCTGWDANQRRAYIIADNRSALSAGWDLEVLALELKELEDADYNLALTAFDETELAELMANLPEIDPDADPDDAPPLPKEPVTVEGDVWVLGPHRLCCGSSLSLDDWDRLMQGERADLVATDPPYNVSIGEKNEALDRADKGNRGKTGGILNDNMSDADFYQFLSGMYVAVFQQMKPGAPIYVAHADTEGVNFRRAFQEAGFKLQSCLIWRKNVLVLGRSDYQWIHEPILYGWKPGSAHRWYGGRKNTSVINLGEGSPFTKMDDGRYQVRVGDSVLVVSADAMVEEHPSSIIYEPKPAKSGLHPTQKPVALMERLMKQSARTGDIVIDAFGGSGTTLIAADRLGMCARLMELDPAFADVIVRRWQALTGRRAVHAVTGEPFPEEGELRQIPPVLDAAPDGDVF
jgi:DNA modification methylase